MSDAPSVLVLEDEAMIALLLEDMLIDLGRQVVGPAYRVAEAMKLVEAERFDAAILDVNVAGEKSFAVADALRRKGVPFAFATGYGESALPPEHAGAPVIEKPYRLADIQNFLATLDQPAA